MIYLCIYIAKYFVIYNIRKYININNLLVQAIDQ